MKFIIVCFLLAVALIKWAKAYLEYQPRNITVGNFILAGIYSWFAIWLIFNLQ